MSERPLISICIPAYNRPEGLRSALRSIVFQKGFDDEVEVLVIDDASPIDTRESAKPFYEKFKNIRYIKNKTNLGFEKNILRLFNTFRGQYFFFLSDDDQLLPEALTKIKKLIRTYPDCTVFSSGYELVLEKQKKTVSHRIFEESKIISRKQIKDVVKLYSDTHALSRVVIRRDAIDTNGFKRHIGSMYPHMYVIGKAALTGNAYYTSELLVRHAAENEVFWEYKDDYMIKGQVKMINDLSRIDERFYKEAFPAVVIRPIPYITYHALKRGPQAFIRLVLALSAIPEIGYNPLVWFKIGTQMIFQSFAKFLNTSLLLLFIIAFFLWFFYLNLNTPGFLNFSDGAKFADIARNVVNGFGYGGSFNFFGTISLEQAKQFPFPAPWTPPVMPLSIAGVFKILGISDFAVVATSGLFYISLVLATFVLGRKLFGNLVGFLSAVAIAANLNFLDYATSGASEVLFALEVVLAAYFFIFRKNWATTLGFLTLTLMYLTRPQAFLFIAGFIFLWLLLRFNLKRALLISLVLGIVGLVVDRLILEPLAGRFFLYPILGRGVRTFFQYSPLAPASIGLRAELPTTELITSQWAILSKKVFFNLYNFYKLLPQIASPYLWALFGIGLFTWGKDRTVNALKFVILLLVIGIFVITALTIPFFRYLHPVIPLVYLFAVATLVWIVETVVRVQWSGFSGWRTQQVALVASLLVFVFVVGQTLGVIFLDSRFWAARRNIGKPPVYVQLSWILRDNTEPDDVIITNLDTWGSWYGERRTIWYPLRPEQLIPPEGKEIPFDAIYLTSYLIDDENYYMGEEWRQAFLNPEKIQDKFISQNFKFAGEFTVSPDETYERESARAVLFVRKK